MKENDAYFLKPLISAHFRQTRERLSLSQAAMAEALSVSTRHYSDLERGVSMCSVATMTRYISHCKKERIPYSDLTDDMDNLIIALDQGE